MGNQVRLPKYSDTYHYKFPSNAVLNTFVKDPEVKELLGKLDDIVKLKYEGETLNRLWRHPDSIIEKLKEKYREETGNHPIYNGEFTPQFIIWKSKLE